MPWYIVQVMAGREQRMCQLIQEAIELESKAMHEGALDEDRQGPSSQLVRELFVPMMRTGKKQQGTWVQSLEVLLPGYLVAVTDRPEDLNRALRRVDGFARLVHCGNAFAMLPEDEVRWLEAHTGRNTRLLEISEGYMQDGLLHVVSGPLVGKEYQVKKVNHRKKTAYLEFKAGGVTVKAQVGLRITRKRS